MDVEKRNLTIDYTLYENNHSKIYFVVTKILKYVYDKVTNTEL